jgi:hypothetical protein
MRVRVLGLDSVGQRGDHGFDTLSSNWFRSRFFANVVAA